jgi:hypothetical protein
VFLDCLVVFAFQELFQSLMLDSLGIGGSNMDRDTDIDTGMNSDMYTDMDTDMDMDNES